VTPSPRQCCRPRERLAERGWHAWPGPSWVHRLHRQLRGRVALRYATSPAILYKPGLLDPGHSRIEPLLHAITAGMSGRGSTSSRPRGMQPRAAGIACRYDGYWSRGQPRAVQNGARRSRPAGLLLTFMAKVDAREGNSCTCTVPARRRRQPGDGRPDARCPPSVSTSWPVSWRAAVSSPCCSPRTSTPTALRTGQLRATAIAWGRTTGPARCGWSGTGRRAVENRVPGGDVNHTRLAAVIASGCTASSGSCRCRTCVGTLQLGAPTVPPPCASAHRVGVQRAGQGVLREDVWRTTPTCEVELAAFDSR